jgi:general L-amino acid transport system substrate-binding protein
MPGRALTRAAPAWALCFTLINPAGTAAATLDEVRERGTVRCSVNPHLAGFSERDGDTWKGFDVDFCRAVAAATLGDSRKTELVVLDNQQRLEALRRRQVDVLVRNTTWTFARDTGHGMSFVGVNYYDNQGLMVRRGVEILDAVDAEGLSICVQSATTSEQRIRQFYERHERDNSYKRYPTMDDAAAAYGKGECDGLTSDKAQLYSVRAGLEDPHRHRILDADIMKEPLGIAVRDDDGQWFDIVRWSLFALLNAEEFGIASTRLDELKARSDQPDVRFMLGLEGHVGKPLGLDDAWVERMIRQVGNYAEIFERNLGEGSPLGIPRGLNTHWRRGGLLFAPTMR